MVIVRWGNLSFDDSDLSAGGTPACSRSLPLAVFSLAQARRHQGFGGLILWQRLVTLLAAILFSRFGGAVWSHCGDVMRELLRGSVVSNV